MLCICYCCYGFMCRWTAFSDAFYFQEIASKKLLSLSASFLHIASSSGKRSGQVIDETARSLMSAISNILEASLFTGKNVTNFDGR